MNVGKINFKLVKEPLTTRRIASVKILQTGFNEKVGSLADPELYFIQFGIFGKIKPARVVNVNVQPVVLVFCRERRITEFYKRDYFRGFAFGKTVLT